jgi:hypothetical protein
MSPIPWGALLTHGPTLVAAAERLLAGTKTPQTAKTALKTDNTDSRLGALEQSSEASARLLQEIAQQLQAIGIAQAAVARQTAAAIKLGIAAVVLAATAIVVAALW